MIICAESQTAAFFHNHNGFDENKKNVTLVEGRDIISKLVQHESSTNVTDGPENL